MVVCENPIELISLNTDSTNSIIKITIQTKEMTFVDFESFRDKFVDIVQCINDALGKEDEFKDDLGNMWVGWNLNDINIAVTFTVENMTSFAKNEKRKFQLIWKKYNKPKLW